MIIPTQITMHGHIITFVGEKPDQIKCCCGSEISFRSYTRHIDSKKHWTALKGRRKAKFEKTYNFRHLKFVFEGDEMQWVICACGSVLRPASYAQHTDSQRHRKYMSAAQIPIEFLEAEG
jgi:hypothetical protein